jgi:hypothetical protein
MGLVSNFKVSRGNVPGRFHKQLARRAPNAALAWICNPKQTASAPFHLLRRLRHFWLVRDNGRPFDLDFGARLQQSSNYDQRHHRKMPANLATIG